MSDYKLLTGMIKDRGPRCVLQDGVFKQVFDQETGVIRAPVLSTKERRDLLLLIAKSGYIETLVDTATGKFRSDIMDIYRRGDGTIEQNELKCLVVDAVNNGYIELFLREDDQWQACVVEIFNAKELQRLIISAIQYSGSISWLVNSDESLRTVLEETFPMIEDKRELFMETTKVLTTSTKGATVLNFVKADGCFRDFTTTVFRTDSSKKELLEAALDSDVEVLKYLTNASTGDWLPVVSENFDINARKGLLRDSIRKSPDLLSCFFSTSLRLKPFVETTLSHKELHELMADAIVLSKGEGIKHLMQTFPMRFRRCVEEAFSENELAQLMQTAFCASEGRMLKILFDTRGKPLDYATEIFSRKQLLKMYVTYTTLGMEEGELLGRMEKFARSAVFMLGMMAPILFEANRQEIHYLVSPSNPS